jgi:hypothetical protein
VISVALWRPISATVSVPLSISVFTRELDVDPDPATQRIVRDIEVSLKHKAAQASEKGG